MLNLKPDSVSFLEKGKDLYYSLIYKVFGVEREEAKKLILSCMLFLSITTCYAILRKTKDTIIYSQLSGTHVGYIKLFFVTPSSLILFFIVALVTNRVSSRNLFIALHTPFLLIFSLYSYIYLYNPSMLSILSIKIDGSKYIATQIMADLLQSFGEVIFYLAAEMYGSIIVSFAFWQFINRYTLLRDAKRLYSYITLSATLALIVSGSMNYIINSCFGKSITGYQHTGLHILASVIMILISYLLYIPTFREYYNYYTMYREEFDLQMPKKKVKLSFIGSIVQIIYSAEVRMIFLTVLSYNIMVNMLDNPFKDMLKTYTKHDSVVMSYYLGLVQVATSFCIIISAYLCPIILSRGWIYAAMIPPIAMGVSGVAFTTLSLWIPTKPAIIFAAVICGMFSSVMARSLKYSLVDNTKEIAIMHLDKDIRGSGKAAIEIIGGRIGKGAGALVITILTNIYVPYTERARGIEIIRPYINIFIIISLLLWFYGVFRTNYYIKQKDKLEKERATTE